MMKPSRSLSKGRLARSGSSLRVDSARSWPKPPTLIGVIAASDPPAIIASASPRLMISYDSPTACADAEQAVHVARLGPLAPKRIDTCPEARLDRKSTRLNSSHSQISYAVFCLKKKINTYHPTGPDHD